MNPALIPLNSAISLLPLEGVTTPVRVVGNPDVLRGFDETLWQQVVNVAKMPGAERVIISPDAHVGYGCPVGCTVVSSSHIYPPVVGPDASCSMGMSQTDVEESQIADKRVRRELINAITARLPTGMGARQAPKGRKLSVAELQQVVCHGAEPDVLENLGIDPSWSLRLENTSYGDPDALWARMPELPKLIPNIAAKIAALGSLGAGNHFLSGDITDAVDVTDNYPIQSLFGLRNGCLSFLSHCGSRGFGYQLMAYHAKLLESKFQTWGIPFSGGDRHLTYAPLGTTEANNYLMDMRLAANFAVVNHLLIHTLCLEAVKEVLPGAQGHPIYHVNHNIGQEEILHNRKVWVFRKGATRAFPAGHPQLKDTIFAQTGHPILLPGNARDGSVIMVAEPGVVESCFTVSHGAGRAKGRKQAKRELNQRAVEQNLSDNDIMYNGRQYPLDEAPDAYKNFNQVIDSIEMAKLARTVAKLRTKFVIKDNEGTAEGAA